jgi:hypothetical protein
MDGQPVPAARRTGPTVPFTGSPAGRPVQTASAAPVKSRMHSGLASRPGAREH